MLIIIVILVVLCLWFLGLAIYYSFKEKRDDIGNVTFLMDPNLLDDNKEKENNDKREINRLPFSQYNNLFLLFRESMQYVTTIKEINKLIDKDVKVMPITLKNNIKDEEYKSFDNLIYWRDSYLIQLILYFALVKDVYYAYSLSLTHTSRDIYDAQLIYISDFIQDQIEIIEKEEKNEI